MTDELTEDKRVTCAEAARLMGGKVSASTIREWCHHDGNGDTDKPALRSFRVECNKSGEPRSQSSGKLMVSMASLRAKLLRMAKGPPHTLEAAIVEALLSLPLGSMERVSAAYVEAKRRRVESAQQLNLKPQPARISQPSLF
jgi:hypothetical protein